MFVKRYLFYYWNGILLTGLNVLLFLGCGVLYVAFVGVELLMWVVIGLCTVSLYLFMQKNIHSTIHFLKDVEKEQELNMRWVGMLLDTGGHVEKQPLFTRSKPYLFSKSQRIFKRSGGAYRLAEIYIKLFLRDKSSIKLYLQLTGITMVGMFLLPVWAKGVLWLATMTMLLALLMIKEKIRQSGEHSYLNMFRWHEATRQNGIEIAHFYLLLPISLVTGAVVGWFVLSWIGMLLFLCASLILARMCKRIVR
ncbi:ABC transporter permease [Natribacillus halophilus]|uniref:ABC transporter protein EcsB n=1 Tax=Natribacillus halophilus TaxID=549003 RepID=A0A1G8NIJ7_9BACI|nr:ABC transporter permease [Natribacillus halophilus]SDI80069.1 ABC transporter protein EcsB [Natribacillus halophilus]